MFCNLAWKKQHGGTVSLLEEVFDSKIGLLGSEQVQNDMNSASITMSFEKPGPSKPQSLLFLQILRKKKSSYIF